MHLSPTSCRLASAAFLALALLLSSCNGDDDGSSGDGTNTDCSTLAGNTAQVVCFAEKFMATLSTSQQGTVQYTFTATNATNWSNLPVGDSPRNGIKFGDLSSSQLAAAQALVVAALSTPGSGTFDSIRVADEFLHTSTGNDGWGAGLYYIAFLGTPSTTSTWMLQLSGHHYALNMVYKGNPLPVSPTPFFVGVEPQEFTMDGVTYAPLNGRRDAIYAVIQSLGAQQRAAARLGASFDDVLLGPGQDGQFPAQEGLPVSSLSAAQHDLVKAAIGAWVRDAPEGLASVLLDVYESDAALAQTFVAWSGATTPTEAGSYVRIDGPRVWIEFVCQNGVAFPTQIHFHTIWRDKTMDYGGSFSF